MDRDGRGGARACPARSTRTAWCGCSRAAIPATGALLRPAGRSGAVAGFDLTFRAPKSVSILFGVAEPEVAQRGRPRARGGGRARRSATSSARRAGRAAGAAARSGCRGAGFVGGGVPASVVAGGRSAAAHARRRRERDAGRGRALDRARRPRAVPARQDRRLPLPGGAARRADASGSGCAGSAVEHGTADLAGVPRRVIEHFSQRRAEILEHMARARRALGAGGADRDARDAPAQGLRRAGRPAARGVAGARRRARPRPRRAESRPAAAPRERRSRRDAGWPAARGPDGLTRDRVDVHAPRRRCRRSPRRARDGATRRGDRGRRADAFLARDEIVELEPAGRRAPVHARASCCSSSASR